MVKVFRNATVVVRAKEEVNKVKESHRELRWKVLCRTHHLALKANGNHIQLMGYVRRDEFASNNELSDMLLTELELLTDKLEKMEDLHHD